jgi:glutamyl-tRNA synthetase
MNDKIRVRFAPSPTGPLHIGGVRTALYNYLFAKKHNGTFILRIEDTDQTRFVPGATDYILASLKWCGIEPQEGPHTAGKYGPYTQSERKIIYQNHIEQLIQSGHAYYAFDTADELEQKREQEKTSGNPNWQYDASTRGDMRNSLTLSHEETKELLSSGATYTIRAKIEPNQTVNFNDIIRGEITVQTNVLDDKVLFKSDGLPTYHFANIVDDHLMEISHVIRGEEWLPSTALHHLLYNFFGWKAPEFAHLPLILKPDGKGKLSKRDGDQLGFPVFPLNWETAEGEIFPGYRENGYLQGAFINMLAFLGWNPGTEQEIFNLEELTAAFSLERVNKSGARFDPDKTKWFQQQYLKNLTNEEVYELINIQFPESNYSEKQLQDICGLFKERVTFPQEIIAAAAYFFSTPKEYDEKTKQKKWKDNSAALLQDLALMLENTNTFSAEEIEQVFHKFLGEKEVGLGNVMPILRLALTGQGGGPQIFEIAELLGQQVVLERIQQAIKTLG